MYKGPFYLVAQKTKGFKPYGSQAKPCTEIVEFATLEEAKRELEIFKAFGIDAYVADCLVCVGVVLKRLYPEGMKSGLEQTMTDITNSVKEAMKGTIGMQKLIDSWGMKDPGIPEGTPEQTVSNLLKDLGFKDKKEDPGKDRKDGWKEPGTGSSPL